jgi:hypothetical protein
MCDDVTARANTSQRSINGPIIPGAAMLVATVAVIVEYFTALSANNAATRQALHLTSSPTLGDKSTGHSW